MMCASKIDIFVRLSAPSPQSPTLLHPAIGNILLFAASTAPFITLVAPFMLPSRLVFTCVDLIKQYLLNYVISSGKACIIRVQMKI